MAKRFKKIFPNGFKPTFHPERLKEPYALKKPSRIFVCSIADLFAPWTPLAWRNAVLDAIYNCPIKHTFILLTKNPENVPKGYVFPDNVWVGTTVTMENGDWKNIEEIKTINAKVKFVSFEPLLGLLPDNVDLKGLQWVIIGKLTGSKKVKLDSYWVSRILGETERHNIPVFMKNNLCPEWSKVGLIQQFPPQSFFLLMKIICKGAKMKLSLWQHIQLKLAGSAFLKWGKPQGYSDYVPWYAVRCKIHGVYEDTPHGHSGYFSCPKCPFKRKFPSFSTFSSTNSKPQPR